MDSDSTTTQPHPPPYHHHPHHHTQPSQTIMMGPTTTACNNSYPTMSSTTTTNTAPPPPPPSATKTTTVQVPSSVPVMLQSQQHQTQTQNPNPNNLPRFPFNSVVNSSSSPAVDYPDGSAASPRTSGFSIEPARKKRGRPRKYSPDGNIALGLSPTPVTAMSPVAGGQGDYSGGGGGTGSSEPQAKRSRGRPPGSGKKQLNALGNAGVGFTPHVITVKAGEDIASKVMAFAQQGPRTVCILSANGAMCNVTLRQSAMSGGTVTYEGRFEIISLSGSFMPSENGSRNRTGGLSVSLAGSDGRVLGGGVAGMLMAASPVQVVVGSFVADGKKPKSAPPSTLAPNMLTFGGLVSAASPPSQDASSDSSDENGDSQINHGPGSYNNAGQSMSMPMYGNMGWPNNSLKMN